MDIHECHTNHDTGYKKKLKTAVDKFNHHRWTDEAKRGTKWHKQQEKYALEFQNGFNIRATNSLVVQALTTEYDVQETEEETKLHSDNCVPDPSTGVCPRKRWCGGVDKTWWVKAKKRRARVLYRQELEQKKKGDSGE